MIDRTKIEKLVKQLLAALNDDPEREGLRETPRRVADYYAEMFEGQNYTNEQIAKKFGKCFKQKADGQIVKVDDITVFSHCEHHLALMYDMKVSIRYIPHGKVLGLSKFARIAEMVAKRLQLQEKIGSDIAEVVRLATGSDDVEVSRRNTPASRLAEREARTWSRERSLQAAPSRITSLQGKRNQ